MKTQINNGHRHLSEAARRYARVLYELEIPADAVKESERIFSETPELGEVLCSPIVSPEKKFGLIERIFPAEIRNFLKTACRHHRLDIAADIFCAYEEYCREQEHIVSAVLSCTEPPSEEQLEKMEAFLCGRYGAVKAKIQVCRDESLLGGFVLRVGNDEYDWSIKGRLDRLKQKLTWR